jgi:hypothetical protein
MKFIKTFESYEVDSTCPSREEMISHLCACGYNEAECDEMSMDDLEMQYNECGGGMAYEAKKHRAKAKAKAKAKKKMPDFPNVDGDGDTDEPISKANRDKKAAQAGKGHSKADDKKTQSQAQGKLSAAQKKLPPALQKAIAAKRK